MYMQVKAQAVNTETIFSQMVEIWQRWKARRRGEFLSLESILDTLDPTSLSAGDDEDDEKILHVTDLVSEVKGLSEQQAMEIVKGALQNWDQDNQENSSMSDAMQKIQVIDNYMNMIHWALGELVNLRTM